MTVDAAPLDRTTGVGEGGFHRICDDSPPESEPLSRPLRAHQTMRLVLYHHFNGLRMQKRCASFADNFQDREDIACGACHAPSTRMIGKPIEYPLVGKADHTRRAPD